MKIIKTFETFISQTELVDFDSFSKKIRDTLKNEYGQYYQHNFDWNTKQNEFIKNPKGFSDWLKRNESEEFLKNINNIIQKIRQDLILLHRKKIAAKALDAFEELIIPVLGNDVLCEPLTKFMETVLLNPDLRAEDFEKAYQEAKNIIDAEGNIDQDKITPSTLFDKDNINIAKFERFVKKNPEYAGVFKDWKRLFDKDIELTLIPLNAFRSSTPYENIKELYYFLIDFKKKNGLK